MIYKKHLRRERPNQTVIRKVTIVLSHKSNPGFIVEVEDTGTEGHVFLSRIVGTRTPEWISTKENAFALADGIVESSKNEGFVLLAGTR